MRFVRWFWLSLGLMTGCEQLLPLLTDDHGQPPPDQPAPPSIERASTFMALEHGRVMSATTQGLRIIDVRDARHPRVEGAIDLVSDVLGFYRVGDHVILLAQFIRGYAGERDDIPLQKQADALLFNIDISDRAHPTIVDQLAVDDLPRESLLRKAPDGSALFIFPMIYDQIYHSRVERYDLRDGVLQKTAQLLLDSTAEVVDATPEKLLVATQRPGAEQATITVLDIAAGALRTSYRAWVRGRVGSSPTRLAIDGNQLRVSYSRIESNVLAIGTFDMSMPPTAEAARRCESSTPAYSIDALTFSNPANGMIVNSSSAGELTELAFDAAGNCTEVSFGPNSSSYQLQASAPGRMLSVGPSGASLYDTTSNAEMLLARVALPAPFTGARPSGPIQTLPLPRPTQAADGTAEPQLAGIPINGWPEANGFQLLTLSDHTLTLRGKLDLRAQPNAFAVLDNTLVAASSTELRTFDAHDLDHPGALGQLELAERYGPLFGVGDYIARIRYDPFIGPPEEQALHTHNDLQILRRSDARNGAQPIASLSVAPMQQWLQVGHVLVNAELAEGPWNMYGEPTSEIALQAYDLSDPTHPRKAGRLETTEIEALWSAGHFPEGSISYQSVGQALVVQQWKRLPDTKIRQCSTEVSYDVCTSDAAPSCPVEYYSGSIMCQQVDDDPELCNVYVRHCLEGVCETVSTLPPGIPVGQKNCYEFSQPHKAQTYAFDVVDFRDPDRPTLVRPQLVLPDGTVNHDFYVSGDKIHTTEQMGDAMYARVIDLTDPTAPTISLPRPVPESIVAVDRDVVYTASRGFEQSALTLSRARCCSGDSQPIAARTWPERRFVSLVPDGAGHVYLMHGPLGDTGPSPVPSSQWNRLEILDAQTLETLGALDIDTGVYAPLPPVHGELLVEGYGTLFVVDVHDPQRPNLQAALPFSGGGYLLDGERIIVSDEGGLRSYPLDVRTRE